MGQVRHRHAKSLLAVLLLSLTPQVRAAPQLVPATSLEGRPVASITFDPPRQSAEAFDLHAGEPYSAAAIRDSIERLYATGRYADIQVDASDGPAGIALRYITRGSWFIGHVGVEGDLSDPPAPSQLVSAAKLELGMPFDEPQLATAETNILQLLRGNGYFNAQVSHELKFEAEHQQVRITFLLSSGYRAHYAPPVINGNTSVMSQTKIEKATPWRRFLLPGYRGVTQNRTRDGMNGIRLKFQDASHLLAIVTLDPLEAIDGRHATPHISIQPGPLVEVTASGAKLRARLKKLLRSSLPMGLMIAPLPLTISMTLRPVSTTTAGLARRPAFPSSTAATAAADDGSIKY